MAEPKIPPGAWDDAIKLLTKYWEEGGKPETKAVLDDLIEQSKGATEGLRAKVFGDKSLEVKKDLLKKVSASGGPLDTTTKNPTRARNQAGLFNQETKTERRINHLEDTGQIDDWEGRPAQWQMDEITTHNPSVDMGASRVTGDEYRNSQYRAVKAPNPESENRSHWENLMDDPAYPAIAAGVAGGAAALASSNANASTAKSYMDEPDVSPTKSAPSADYLNEPDVAPQAAPQPAMAAPVAAPPIEAPAPTAPAEEKPDYLNDAIRSFTPYGAIQTAEKYVVDPAIKALQEKVGSPALDLAIEGQKALGLGNVVPGQEYLNRAGGQWLAGGGQLEKFGGTVTGAKNITELTTKVGEIPAAMLAAGSKLMGDVPLFMIQGPKTGTAILDHFAAGALIGLADPEMSMTEGAAGAVALSGAGKALGKVGGMLAKGARKVYGVVDRAFVDTFADKASKMSLEFGAPKAELAGYGGEAGKLEPELKLGPLGESRRIQNATGGLDAKPETSALSTLHAMSHNPELVKLVMGKASDLGEKIKPMYGRVVVDDAGGLVARFDEPNPGNVLKRVEIPLKTNSDFVKLRGTLDRDLDNVQFNVSPEADAAMTPEARRALNYQSSLDADNPSSIDTGPEHFFLTQNGERLELHEINSTQGKIAALDHQGGLVAIDTPDGPKYGRALTDETVRAKRGNTSDIDMTQGEIDDAAAGAIADKTKKNRPGMVGVLPFEPHEGIPTFGGIHPVDNLRNKISDEELTKVLEKRVTPPPPPRTLDEELDSKFNKSPAGPYGGPNTQKLLPNRGSIPFNEELNRAGGSPPPPPDVPEAMPPAPPPGPPPPPEADIADRITKMSAKMPLWDRIQRQLVGAHLRAPLDLAGYVSDQQSVKNLAANWANTNSSLEKRAGVGATQEFRQDIDKLFRGNLSFEDFTKKAENNAASKEAWIGIRDMVGDAVAQRDSNQAWLAGHGYVPDETWEQSEGDAVTSYATREYMAHFLKPGQWLDVVKNDEKVMRDAIEGYKTWAKKGGKELETEDALSKIVESLGTKDPGTILFGDKATSGSASPTGKLSFRKDLPDWYRRLLGENRDGFLSVSRTLAAQDALIANFKVFEGVAANPAWAADKKMGPKWEQFPDNKRLYGKMAGKWASPEVYDSLYTIPNIKNEVNKWIAVPLGIVKTNQVSLGSFRTFLNMTMDNLMGGVLSGGLDLTKPIEAGKALSFAARAMAEHSSMFKANPLGTGELAQFIKDARRIGVDAPGHIGASLSETQSRLVKDAYSEIAGVKGESSSFMSKFYELHQRAGAKGSMVVDGIDRVQKLASWKILTDKFEEAGEDREGAMRHAARRIFSSYPMYDRVGLLTDKMRTSALGIVSPYSTFAMERNRILGSIPKRLLDSVSNGASDDPSLHFRLLKYAVIGAAMYAGNGAFRRGFGNVSDADVEYAMQKRRGSGQEKFSPEDAQWVAPFMDGRGNPAVVDMTQWLGPLSYLQGDQSLAPIANIAMNVVKQPLSGGMLGAGVDTAMRGMGINASFEPRPAVPGQSKTAFAADAAMDSGLAPRGLMDLYKNVRSTGALGDIGPGRATLTPIQAGLRTIPGIPFEQGATERGKTMQVSADVSHARAILYKAATMKPDHAAPLAQKVYEVMNKLAGGDPEAKRLRDEAGKMIKNISQEINKTSKAARAAKESK